MRWAYIMIPMMLMVGGSRLEGASVWTHVWVGIQPEVIDLWRQPGPLQDVAFANAVEAGGSGGWIHDPDSWFVRKFYMIGLTLPDMFDPVTQRVLQDLVDSLYTIADLIQGPLDVRDVTYQQTRSMMRFQGLPPNQNFEKLRQMVVYAQQHNFTLLEKALIYGIYVHVLQDYVAHMALQPSLYGYGKTVDPPEAVDQNWLEVAEYFYELLAPTWIPDSAWAEMVLDMYSAYEYNNRGCQPQGAIKGLRKPSAFRFYARVVRGGDLCPGDQFWQGHPNLEALRGLVDAMQGVGYGSNVTYERLRAYMWAWGVLNFLMAGYHHSDISGTAGGLFRHPEWTPVEIRDWFRGLGDENFHLLIEIRPGVPLVDEIVAFLELIVNTLLGTIEEILNIFDVGWVSGGMALAQILYGNHYDVPECQAALPATVPWVEILADTAYVDGFAACLDALGVEIATTVLSDIGGFVRWWQRYGSQRKPMLHIGYRREMRRWEELFAELREARDRGISELHYRDHNWEISRKSGVLGGFWDVPNDRVIEQPGVFRLHFRRQVGGDTVVAYTGSQRASHWYVEGGSPVPIEPHLRLHFDLIPFGRTKLYTITFSGDTVSDTLFRDPGRYRGDVELDLQPVLAPGGLPARKDTLFWEIKTAEINNWNVYHPMLKSDYRGPFATRTEISGNAFYQTYFKNGNPLRRPGENPLQDPAHYWPYMLPVEPRLNAPGQANLQVDSQGLHFTWVDRSNVENQYMLSVKAIPWDRDTVYILTKSMGGEDTQSGFLSWEDPKWDQAIPDGTLLRKLIVGIYAVRETTVSGRTLRFFSDIAPAGTLNLSAVVAETLRVDPVNGLRVVWGNYESWASGVRLLLKIYNHEVHPEIGGTPGGRRWFSWRHSLWDSFPDLAPIARVGIYVYRSLGTHGTIWLASVHPVRKTLRLVGEPDYGLPYTVCPQYDSARLVVWPTGVGADGFDLQVYTPVPGDSSGALPVPQGAGTTHFVYPIGSGDTLEMNVRAYRILGQQQRKAYTSWRYAGRAYGENALDGSPVYVDARAWVVRGSIRRRVYLRDPRGCTPPIWVGQGLQVSVARAGDTLWVVSQDTGNAQITTSVWQNGRWVRIHRETHTRGGQLVVDAVHRLYLYYKGSSGGVHTLQPMVDVREPDGTWHTLTLPVVHHVTGEAAFLSSSGMPILLIPFTRDTTRNGVDERILGVLRAVFINGQYVTTDTLWKLVGTRQTLPVMTEVHAADLHPGIALVVGTPNPPLSTQAWWFWSSNGNPTYPVAGGRHHCRVDEGAGYAVVECDRGSVLDPVNVHLFAPRTSAPVRTVTVDSLGLAHIHVTARFLGIDPRTHRPRYRLTLYGLREDSVTSPFTRTSMHMYDLGVVEEAVDPAPAAHTGGGREGLQQTLDSVRVGMWTLRISDRDPTSRDPRLVLAEEGRNPVGVLSAPDLQLNQVVPTDSGLEVRLQVSNGKGGWIPLTFTLPVEGSAEVLDWEVLGQDTGSRWLIRRAGASGALDRARDVGDTLKYAIVTASFSGKVGFLFWGARADTVFIRTEGCGAPDTATIEPNLWNFRTVTPCSSASDTLRFTLTARQGPVELRRISLYGTGQVLAAHRAVQEETGSGTDTRLEEIPRHFGWSRRLVSQKKLLKVAVPAGGEVHIRIFDLLGRLVYRDRIRLARGGWIEVDLRQLPGRGIRVVDVEWNGRRDRGRVLLP